MKSCPLVLLSLLVLLHGASFAQLLDPHKLREAEPTDTWPTSDRNWLRLICRRRNFIRRREAMNSGAHGRRGKSQ